MTEITLHLLDVMLAHSVRSKQSEVPPAGQSGMADIKANMDFTNNNNTDNVKAEAIEGSLGDCKDEPYAKDVAKILQRCKDEKGLSIYDIIKQTEKVGEAIHA